MFPSAAIIATLALAHLSHAASPCDGDILVTSYGAVGDGVHDDGAAIRASIAAGAACASGSRVILPAVRGANATTFLSGPIWLESDMQFVVDEGVTLKASTTFTDFPLVWQPSGFGFSVAGFVNAGRCVASDSGGCTAWHKLRNVTLSGRGTIDGSGEAWWNARAWWPSVPCPYLLNLLYVNGLVIQDLTLFRSARWTIVPSLSTNVLIERITLDGGVARDGALPYDGMNVDGLDSNNVVNMTLRDSWLFAGDDCVAINSRHMNVSAGDFPTRNVTIGPNVTCRTPITIGSGTGLGITDVSIIDSLVDARWGNRSLSWRPMWYHTALRFKTARNRGPAGVSGVTVRNITGLGVDLMVDFQFWYSCQNSSGVANYEYCRRTVWPTPVANAPSYRHVSFKGLYGDAWRPVWISCLPEAPCEDVTFDDVDLVSAAPEWVCEHVHGSAGANVSPPPGSCLLPPQSRAVGVHNIR